MVLLSDTALLQRSKYMRSFLCNWIPGWFPESRSPAKGVDDRLRPCFSGDVLWSEVPAGAAPAGSALRYIVHALAPDLSHRPKRLPSGLNRDQAFATLVVVYYRAMWQATTIAGPECSIGMPPLGSGVFANDPADVQNAAALAHGAPTAKLYLHLPRLFRAHLLTDVANLFCSGLPCDGWHGGSLRCPVEPGRSAAEGHAGLGSRNRCRTNGYDLAGRGTDGGSAVRRLAVAELGATCSHNGRDDSAA